MAKKVSGWSKSKHSPAQLKELKRLESRHQEVRTEPKPRKKRELDPHIPEPVAIQKPKRVPFDQGIKMTTHRATKYAKSK